MTRFDVSVDIRHSHELEVKCKIVGSVLAYSFANAFSSHLGSDF